VLATGNTYDTAAAAACCRSSNALTINLCFRLTGVEAMGKVMQAWSSGNLYPDIPPALSKINNAGMKVGTLLLP
jgi:hypothetical protein